MYLQFSLIFRVLGVIVLEVTLKVPTPPTTLTTYLPLY